MCALVAVYRGWSDTPLMHTRLLKQCFMCRGGFQRRTAHAAHPGHFELEEVIFELHEVIFEVQKVIFEVQ